jgi:hypothetical protein
LLFRFLESLDCATLDIYAAYVRREGAVGILLPWLDHYSRRSRCSRLLSVLDHSDPCSRLQITGVISGVLGDSVLISLCIYIVEG